MLQVVAGIITKGDQILLARRAAHKLLPGKWEFPGGKIEREENPEAALEREILEEFGVTITAGAYLTTSRHDYGDFQIELLAYFAKYDHGEFSLTDHDRIAWVHKEELHNYDLAAADVPITEALMKRGKSFLSF